MFFEIAQHWLSRLLEIDTGLSGLEFDQDGKVVAIGRINKEQIESVFFLQKEYGETVIRLQVNGSPLSKEIQDSRKFKKYWKAKSRVLEEQGVHLGIGDSSQIYFSVVTRTELQDLDKLLSVESQLRQIGVAVAGEIEAPNERRF